MAKKNNNQVSAVRQAKHGWIWTLHLRLSAFYGLHQFW